MRQGAPQQRRSPQRRLSDIERAAVLDVLHSPEFDDQPPTEVFAALLSRGEYMGNRISKLQADDLTLQFHRGSASSDVTIPFTEIQEVTIANASGDVVLIATQLGIPSAFVPGSQAGINLRTAAKFAVLAGAAVTSTGNTDVTGDLGVWAGTSISGFTGITPGGPGIVHGTIHSGDSAAQIAQGNLTTAFNDAAGRTLAPVDVANADLGGRIHGA